MEQSYIPELIASEILAAKSSFSSPDMTAVPLLISAFIDVKV